MAKSVKLPRFIRPYPKKVALQIRRRKRRPALKTDLLQQARPRQHAKPRGIRTKLDAEMYLQSRAANVMGSLQERLFYQALVDHGFIPGVDFDLQSGMFGGRAELGGLVADFLFPAVMVVVQVQSMWHTLTLEHERRDSDQAAVLQSLGYTVLEIWPNTLEDMAALDMWIDRNISTLWGTSKQALGIGAAPEISYLQIASYNQLITIERLLDDILVRV
jgi:very-short-patch-repair endonuclease